MTLLGRSWLSTIRMRAVSYAVIASKPRVRCTVYIGRLEGGQSTSPSFSNPVAARPTASRRNRQAIVRRSASTGGDARPELFRRAARARMDARGAAGAVEQAWRSRSIGLDNRGDRG